MHLHCNNLIPDHLGALRLALCGSVGAIGRRFKGHLLGLVVLHVILPELVLTRDSAVFLRLQVPVDSGLDLGLLLFGLGVPAGIEVYWGNAVTPGAADWDFRVAGIDILSGAWFRAGVGGEG